MDRTTSSKVTVEYHDPSNVFSLISAQLLDKLPLKNLHWKAPTRPLRSIDSLHVDLVPSDETAATHSNDGSNANTPNLTTDDAAKRDSGSRDGPKSAGKERRHQIPGLRRTPYLKLYLIRCDDSEEYKANARKQLREWIKANSQSSGARAENHDASEWLILHVVLPGTPAASQPRWSGTSKDSSGAPIEKTTSGSRWPGRSSSTVYEKIRADFNESSKFALDRVAQVRLLQEEVPVGRVPTIASPTSSDFKESRQDKDNAWGDLISKFKSLILSSFDRRVSQYEEDIRERDAQRALPGWNFCTFFVLKEGLAMGFENVGLVEDALVIYDELSVGLDTVIRDEANGEDARAGSFQESTTELVEQLKAVLDGKDSNSLFGPFPVDARRKPYRELIVSTNVSIYDFRCYVFSRQMALLLRLGNAQSSRTELVGNLQGGAKTLAHQRSRDDLALSQRTEASEPLEDLVPLTELCERASRFVTAAARDMRADFLLGTTSQSIDAADAIIDNMITSWMFAVAQQILDETKTAALPISLFSKDITSDSSAKLKPLGGRLDEQKSSVAEPKTMIHPARSTSLQNRRNSLGEAPYSITPQTSQVLYQEGSLGNFQDAGRRREQMLQANNVALEDLAAHRAELYLIQRRLLEQVGQAAGWTIGWNSLTSTQSVESEPTTEVSLDDEEEETQSPPTASATQVDFDSRGLLGRGLTQAMASKDSFRNAYESLSDMAFKHYTKANRIKASERILGDLAALKFQLRDFTAAAMYFSKMAPLFAEGRWNFVEMTMLKMYAKCVKQLHRKGEYAHVLLDILAKSASRWRSCGLPLLPRAPGAVGGSIRPSNWLNDDGIDTTGFLSELITSASQLPTDQIVAMARYFDKISVETYAHFYEDRDGFKLRVSFRHLLEDTFEATRIKVRVVNATASQSREIWLESDGPVEIARGTVKTWVHSNVTTAGPYIVDRIQIECGKLKFTHEPFSKSEATTPLGLTTSVSATSIRTAKKSRILLYPLSDAFTTDIRAARKIELGNKPRFIEMTCSSGRNDILTIELRIRAASAGLRLRTANTEVIHGTASLEPSTAPGIIQLASLPAQSTLTLRIPYDLEVDPADLIIRLEATYTTPLGTFTFLSSSTIPIKLPLDVKVDDHFKSRALFSRFNIETAHGVPLDVFGVTFQGTKDFAVTEPKGVVWPVTVFAKQPVGMLYKITPKAKVRSEKEDPLTLTIDYRRLDEDVVDLVVEKFTSAIAESEAKALERLLVPALRETLLTRILPAQLEKIALLRTVTLGGMDGFGWFEILDCLPPGTAVIVQAFLSAWHAAHPSLTLPEPSSITTTTTTPTAAKHSAESTTSPRQVTITVPIPHLHILSTALLTLHPPSTTSLPPSSLGTTSPLLPISHPLPATLSITHIRRYTTPASLARTLHLKAPDDAVEFVYEIMANPEVWLVGGMKRAVFFATEGETYKQDIVLVGLKAGVHALPSVSVSVRKPRAGQGQSRSQGGRPGSKDGAKGGQAGGIGSQADEEVLFETEYLNAGETVTVVPDLRGVTVGVVGLGDGKTEGSGSGGQTIVLESEGLGWGEGVNQ